MHEAIVHPPSEDDLSTHLHRQVIGYLGALLPLVLFLLAEWRYTPAMGGPWQPLPSVSAYYYSGASGVFAGVLSALAVYLFTYEGYSNAHYRLDRSAAIIAALAAALVAMFPTSSPWDALRPAWWKDYVGMVHGVAASVLFCCFAFFSLVLFTKSNAPQLSRDKQARNAIYIACGIGILAAIAWAALRTHRGQTIFAQEVMALECFAFSWLAKGRAEWTAGRIAVRAAHYGRHPRQLVVDMRERARRPPPTPGAR